MGIPIVLETSPAAKRIREFGLESFFHFKNGKPAVNGSEGTAAANGIHILEPLGYLDFLCLMSHAEIVVTDSGGIQEETTCLGVPCVTVRENTERPITVTCGTNTIAGTRSENIRDAVKTQRHRQANGGTPEKWDGKAGARIIGTIIASTKRKQNR